MRGMTLGMIRSEVGKIGWLRFFMRISVRVD
jgi:hypothetical protein